MRERPQRADTTSIVAASVFGATMVTLFGLVLAAERIQDLEFVRAML